jgi:cytochrome c556
MTYTFKTIPFALLLAFSCVASCLAGNSALGESQATMPLLHSIHSDQLRQIMLRLNELAYEREYTELSLDRLRAEQIASLVNEARTLADNASRLSDIAGGERLTEEEQITFTAVARQLYSETLQIQADIKANRYETLPGGYRYLQQTCSACHKLFRINK